MRCFVVTGKPFKAQMSSPRRTREKEGKRGLRHRNFNAVIAVLFMTKHVIRYAFATCMADTELRTIPSRRDNAFSRRVNARASIDGKLLFNCVANRIRRLSCYREDIPVTP